MAFEHGAHLPIMWRVVATVVSLLAGASVAAAQNPRKAYLPVAEVIVLASADQASLLLRELNQFAEARHFRVVGGDFPKQGRGVANISIHFGEDTFFHLDNFIAEDKYHLDAYSHDEPRVWRVPWNELVTRLSEILGPDHVQVVKRPPD